MDEQFSYTCFQGIKCHQPHLAHSLESQSYPGQYQKKRGKQAEGGDPAPLLLTGETPPGVLHPALEPSAQESHGPVGAGLEEGHKNNLRAGISLL